MSTENLYAEINSSRRVRARRGVYSYDLIINHSRNDHFPFTYYYFFYLLLFTCVGI
jgi:hypothetical protein